MSTPLFAPLENPASTFPVAGHIHSTPSDSAAAAAAGATASTAASGGDWRCSSARLASEYGSLIAFGEVLRSSGLGASAAARGSADRKSTRLNSSHLGISYAVFCLK